MQEMWVQSLGQEDPLEKGMAIHSSILAWKIPWTEDPGGLQSIGSQRVRNDWVTKTFTFHYSDGNVRFCPLLSHIGLPRCLSGKEFTYQRRRCGFNPWVRKIPWIRKWQSTPVFLPGETHGQRKLGGYSLWGCKKSDMTWAHMHMCMLAKLLQSCLTLCDPMDCSLLGSSDHGIIQARILEWVAIPFSKP